MRWYGHQGVCEWHHQAQIKCERPRRARFLLEAIGVRCQDALKTRVLHSKRSDVCIGTSIDVRRTGEAAALGPQESVMCSGTHCSALRSAGAAFEGSCDEVMSTETLGPRRRRLASGSEEQLGNAVDVASNSMHESGLSNCVQPGVRSHQNAWTTSLQPPPSGLVAGQ